MAEHVDTLDFFGRLENRLALVATMTEAQGQRLDRLSPFEPVAGELCNEINALRVDVAAAVDELRKLARHVAAVEAVVLPAVALAQQMEADRRTTANVVADERPARMAVARQLLELLENRLALVATMTEAQGQRLDRLSPFEPVAGELCNEINALRVDVAAAVDELRKLARHVAAVEAVVLPAVALAQQMEADRRTTANVVADERPARMAVARQLLELRRQGRLLDARALVDPGLATFGLLDLVEQLANGLANMANAPALAQLADVIRRQIRTLADTDARAAQTPVFMVLGPAYPQSDKALEGIKE